MSSETERIQASVSGFGTSLGSTQPLKKQKGTATCRYACPCTYLALSRCVCSFNTIEGMFLLVDSDSGTSESLFHAAHPLNPVMQISLCFPVDNTRPYPLVSHLATERLEMSYWKNSAPEGKPGGHSHGSQAYVVTKPRSHVEK